MFNQGLQIGTSNFLLTCVTNYIVPLWSSVAGIIGNGTNSTLIGSAGRFNKLFFYTRSFEEVSVSLELFSSVCSPSIDTRTVHIVAETAAIH